MSSSLEILFSNRGIKVLFHFSFVVFYFPETANIDDPCSPEEIALPVFNDELGITTTSKVSVSPGEAEVRTIGDEFEPAGTPNHPLLDLRLILLALPCTI